MNLTKDFVRKEMKRFEQEPKRYEKGEVLQGCIAKGYFYDPATKMPILISFGMPIKRVLELEKMGIDWEKYCKLWIEILIEEGECSYPKPKSHSSISQEGKKRIPIILIDPPMVHEAYK